MNTVSEKTLEDRARRAAARANLIARKSRRQHSWENQGEFMLVDARTNFAVAGFQYDMSAQEVIDYCRD